MYFLESCNLHLLHFWYVQTCIEKYRLFYMWKLLLDFITSENSADGQSHEGFLQWKALVNLLFACTEAVSIDLAVNFSLT